jgi:hypothetical protein
MHSLSTGTSNDILCTLSTIHSILKSVEVTVCAVSCSLILERRIGHSLEFCTWYCTRVVLVPGSGTSIFVDRQETMIFQDLIARKCLLER